MRNNSIERFIYLAYIFFLPLGRFLKIDWPGPVGTYLFPAFSCIFFWIGFIMMITQLGFVKLTNPLIARWRNLYFFQVVYSMIAATVLFGRLGILHGEDTYRAIIGDTVFWLVVLLHLVYNYYAITHLVTWQQFGRTIERSLYVIIPVGWMQLLNVAPVYNVLAGIFAITPLEKLNRGCTFWGAEASAASTLFFMVIPYLIANIFIGNHGKKSKRKYIVFLLLVAIPLALSLSSSVLITYVITICAVVIIYMKRKLWYKILLGCTFVTGLGIALLYGLDIQTKEQSFDSESLQYVLIGKAVDSNNMSTLMRASSILNDMKIFFDNPILGVGEGIQGFYYNENVPIRFMISEEVQDVVAGKGGVGNGGGNVFPNFLSAYGLFGLVFLFPLLGYYTRYATNYINDLRMPEYMFMIFIAIFALSAWFSVAIKQNWTVIAMMCMPFWSYVMRKNEGKNCLY